MRAESFIEYGQAANKFQPRLYSFVTDDKCGVEAHFVTEIVDPGTLRTARQREDHDAPVVSGFNPDGTAYITTLVVRTRITANGTVHQQVLPHVFVPKQWTFVTITHKYSMLLSSTLRLFIGANKVCETSLKYPSVNKVCMPPTQAARFDPSSSIRLNPLTLGGCDVVAIAKSHCMQQTKRMQQLDVCWSNDNHLPRQTRALIGRSRAHVQAWS
jgi:hypothetical protein